MAKLNDVTEFFETDPRLAALAWDDDEGLPTLDGAPLETWHLIDFRRWLHEAGIMVGRRAVYNVTMQTARRYAAALDDATG